ncbi:Endophilin-B1 [Nymphon striatum]|nr:Endophilin-B1 [Nymphon striatum]
MDFSFKKFAAGAASKVNRAVQYTEEKLGTSEKTELDAHFESLALRSDTTKQWTEKILMKAESVLTPNPNNRYEDYVYEKLDKKRDRLTNAEHFGLDLIEAGNEFGPGAAYGSALIKVGHSQNKIGQAEKEFIHAAGTNYIQPLHKFLDTDMKTILKERRILESKRLDLDACKSRLRKAKSMESQTSAEQDLRFAQTEFDRQAEITKLLLEGISSTHANHLRCLTDLVDAQMNYYYECYQCMNELQKELASTSLGNFGANSSAHPNLFSNSSSTELGTNKRRAKVLYDYDAQDSTELSLLAEEVITVSNAQGLDSDWLMGERGGQKGKVPKAYLNFSL